MIRTKSCITVIIGLMILFLSGCTPKNAASDSRNQGDVIQNGILEQNDKGMFSEHDEVEPVVNDFDISEDVEVEGKEINEVEKNTNVYTGIVNKDDKLLYYVEGKHDTSFSGVVDYEGEKWLVSHGIVDLNYSGLLYLEEKMWSVDNGKLGRAYNGLAEMDGKMFYWANGSKARNLCGVITYEGERWIVSYGEVDLEYDGTVFMDNKMWNVEGGKVCSLFSGLVESDGETRYYVEGIHDEDYNGVLLWEGESVIISRGNVDYKYEGTIYLDDKMWNTENGKVSGLYTGLAELDGVKHYYVNGVLDSEFSGIFSDGKKEWYVDEGIVNTTYTGFWAESEQNVSVVKNGEVVSHLSKDELIKEYYVEREATWLQMKYEILQVLDNKNYITLDEDTGNTNLIGQAIDALEIHPIASESLKEAIKAAIENESVEVIVDSAVEGAVSGGLSYIDDVLKEEISTAVFGFNIFKGIEKVNRLGELFNLDDTPVVMMNALVEDQEADIRELMGIIAKEEVMVEDVYRAVSLFQKISSRETMLESVSTTDSKVIIDGLDKCAQDYALWNQKIIEMNNCAGYESEEIPAEKLQMLNDKMSRLNQEEVQLYNTTFVPIITDYDLEGFSSVVKAKNGAAVLGKEILGGLVGALMETSNEDWLNATQARHRKFFRQLIEAQVESYQNVLEAKAAYDSAVGLYISLYNEDETEQIKYFNLLSTEENESWEDKRKHLINCIADYKDDLECVYMFYQYTHSEEDGEYGKVIQQEVRKLEDLLRIYEYSFGSEDTDQDETYYMLLNKYAILVEENITTKNVPMFDSVADKYGDGNGFRRIYQKDNYVQVIKKSDSLTYENASIWIYDPQGQPLYVKNEGTEIYFKEEMPIKYSCSDSYAQQMKNYAEKLLSKNK